MKSVWETLPKALRAQFLQSGSGSLSLYGTANACLAGVEAAQDPKEQAYLYALACDVLLAAWEFAPLDPNIAQSLLDLHTVQTFLPNPLLTVVRQCAGQSVPNPSLVKALSRNAARDALQMQELLLQERDRSPNPFFVINRAWHHGLREHSIDWLHDFITSSPMLPEPLQRAFLADCAFAAGDWETAAATYATASKTLPLLTWKSRLAESLYRAGKVDVAVHLWKQCQQARPWNIHGLLRLTDVLAGRDRSDTLPLPENGVVLLYTWNKAADMDATLASVAASDLGNASLFVLDNGSTDETPCILRAWAERFSGRMQVITLPVNIGAPAARNWLLALPEVRQAAWAAFLDDDVAVPAHWLRQLWAALQIYPDAGVAAGHAVDYQAPMSQQWTDMHLNAHAPDTNYSRQEGFSFPTHFHFSAIHEQCFDFGQFTFMRPCMTAIGCCHMFTRQAMDEGGTFDIRFSPSQSDDVDHDMRRALAGHLPIYNGHVRILHKRSTGYYKSFNARSWASASGNWYKLQSSYSPAEIQKLCQKESNALYADALKRERLLGAER